MNASFAHILREWNEVDDALAKVGVAASNAMTGNMHKLLELLLLLLIIIFLGVGEVGVGGVKASN